MKRSFAFSFAVTVLLSTKSWSVFASPSGVSGPAAGESQDTPVDISSIIPHEVKINSSFIELPELNFNTSEPLLGNSSASKPTEPPAESSSSTIATTTTSTTQGPTTTTTSTTTSTTTTVRPQNIVTVLSVPVVDKKPEPVKDDVLSLLASNEDKNISLGHPGTSTPAPKASAETLESLLPSASHGSKPLKLAAEEKSVIKSQQGTLVQEQQTFTSSKGSPIQLSSSSFTSNETPKVSTLGLDPEVSSILKEFERTSRTPETKEPNQTVQKDESSKKIVPVPVIAPHVLHLDPKSGQVFVQPIGTPEAVPVESRIPEKISNNIPGGSGRWFWNLFKWSKKSTPEPTKPTSENNGIHIIKAKKNVKPGEPYYECPLVKASPSPPVAVHKPQQQRSFLFFL